MSEFYYCEGCKCLTPNIVSECCVGNKLGMCPCTGCIIKAMCGDACNKYETFIKTSPDLTCLTRPLRLLERS